MKTRTKASWTLLVGLAAASAGAANYDIAAYVWPAYQPEPRWAELGLFPAGKGEWQNVWEAKPKWAGHAQPRKPLWGYEDEADPAVVAKKIDAAVAHGVNVFIYDWYWYGGRPFLEDGLDRGFLGAPNNGKMKFFVMWANHNVTKLWDSTAADKEWDKAVWPGAVSEKEFPVLVRRWIDRYFTRPNYYRIDGRPVLMVYEVKTFVAGVGGREAARRSLAHLRRACEAAELGVRDYFAHVSVGWDTNPRYPAGTVTETVTNATPAKFAVALERARAWTDAHTRPGVPKLITVNSWNEWTEGSYLEPDETFGFGYLDAVRKTF